MNKSIVAASCAILASASFAADGINSGIVGYTSADHKDQQYVSVGIGFVDVANEGSFKLSSIKPTKWTSSSDALQLLNNTSAGVLKSYSWYGKNEGATEEEEGWYDGEMSGERFDDDEFPVGTAFLGVFGASDAAFSQSGSVLSGGTVLDFTGCSYVMFGNILPKEIKLGDIKPLSWDSSSDALQVLNSESAGVVMSYSWYGKAEGASDDEEGWYDGEMSGDRYDDVIVKPGDAWLGVFGSKSVKIAFPGAID